MVIKLVVVEVEDIMKKKKKSPIFKVPGSAFDFLMLNAKKKYFLLLNNQSKQ